MGGGGLREAFTARVVRRGYFCFALYILVRMRYRTDTTTTLRTADTSWVFNIDFVFLVHFFYFFSVRWIFSFVSPSYLGFRLNDAI